MYLHEFTLTCIYIRISIYTHFHHNYMSIYLQNTYIYIYIYIHYNSPYDVLWFSIDFQWFLTLGPPPAPSGDGGRAPRGSHAHARATGARATCAGAAGAGHFFVEKWWKDWHFCKGFLRCLRHFFWKNVKQILKNEHVLTDFWGFWRDSWKNGERSPFLFLTDFWWIHLVDGKKSHWIRRIFSSLSHCGWLWHDSQVCWWNMVESKILGHILSNLCGQFSTHLVVQFLTVRLLHPAIPSGTRWEISWRRTNIWPRELGELRGWQLSGWSLVPI